MTTWRNVPPDAPEPPPGTIVRTWPNEERARIRLFRDPDQPQELWRVIEGNRYYTWAQVWELAGRSHVEELIVPRPAPGDGVTPEPLLPLLPVVAGPADMLVLNLGPRATPKMINTAVDAIKTQRPDLVDGGRVLVVAIEGMAVIADAAPHAARADETERVYDGG